MTIAVVAIARPTFDVEFAAEFADRAVAGLLDAGLDLVGGPELAMSVEQIDMLAQMWSGTDLEALIVVQATFADSTLVAAAAATVEVPVVLWGSPEPRTGLRLRRNSLCGINLAAFRLASDGIDYRWMYADPSDPTIAARLERALAGDVVRAQPVGPPSGDGARGRLPTLRIGVIGDHPVGFEPCGYDAAETLDVVGVRIERVALDELFDIASSIDDDRISAVTHDLAVRMDLSGVDGAIEPSVRIHAALDTMCRDRGWGAVATRCWPECFTEFGGAACTAQGLLTSLGTPAQCEADAFGAITAWLLQRAAGSVAFTADLVDLDEESDTAVVWHCGIAPFDMADPGERPSGTVHSNRHMPLVSEFALAEGPVTVARLSRSRGHIRMVVGRGEMLAEPRPFAGTAGTIRFQRPVGDVLDTIMAEGLEHHYGIVYGDVTEQMDAVAGDLGIAVVRL